MKYNCRLHNNNKLPQSFPKVNNKDHPSTVVKFYFNIKQTFTSKTLFVYVVRNVGLCHHLEIK